MWKLQRRSRFWIKAWCSCLCTLPFTMSLGSTPEFNKTSKSNHGYMLKFKLKRSSCFLAEMSELIVCFPNKYTINSIKSRDSIEASIKRPLSRKNTPPSQKSTIFFCRDTVQYRHCPFSMPAPGLFDSYWYGSLTDLLPGTKCKFLPQNVDWLGETHTGRAF